MVSVKQYLYSITFDNISPGLGLRPQNFNFTGSEINGWSQ